MAYNKVVYEGETIIDLTRDTVSEDKLLMGEVAHDKSGAQITGTIENKPVSTPDLGVFPPPSSDETLPEMELGLVGDEGLIRGPRPVFLSDHSAIFGVPTNPENEDQLYLMLEPSSGFYTNGTLIATKARAEIVEPSDESVFLTANENGVLESVQVNSVNNLSPENIRYGVVVGNVGGEFKGIGNAVEANVLAGKTFSTDSLFGATGTIPDKRQLDSSIGGINTSYPDVSIWKGNYPQFTTTTVSKERLFGISPQSGYYVGGQSYVGYKAKSVTITPGASQQSVGSSSSEGVLETVTVNAVSNLIAANIKKGATVGGVAGTFTSDANATASQILKDKTAYVNGVKITGTIPMITSGRGDEIVEVGSGDTAYYAIHHIPTGYYYNDNPSTNNWAPEATVLKSKLISYIGLTAAKVMKNQTVAGIAGTATSDANATAANILKNKTAYVNGTKVTGTMVDWTGVPDHITDSRLKDNQFQVAVHTGFHGWSWNGNSYEYMTYAEAANLIGLTAAKIVSGNTILGIAGTGGLKTGIPTGTRSKTFRKSSAKEDSLVIGKPTGITNITTIMFQVQLGSDWQTGQYLEASTSYATRYFLGDSGQKVAHVSMKLTSNTLYVNTSTLIADVGSVTSMTVNLLKVIGT